MSYAAAFGLALASCATSATAAEITGAGATFPFPIYSKWAEAYQKETGSRMNYQSIGSSGGIRQIKAKTVDFGATMRRWPARIFRRAASSSSRASWAASFRSSTSRAWARGSSS